MVLLEEESVQQMEKSQCLLVETKLVEAGLVVPAMAGELEVLEAGKLALGKALCLTPFPLPRSKRLRP